MTARDSRPDVDAAFDRRAFLQALPIATGVMGMATLLAASGSKAAAIGQVAAGDITAVDVAVPLDDHTPMAGTEVPGHPVIKGAERVFYRSADQSCVIGVWEGLPGVARMKSYPVHEYWYLVTGEITFRADSGPEQRFKAGDVFVLPKGFTGTVTIHSKLRKQYVACQ